MNDNNLIDNFDIKIEIVNNIIEEAKKCTKEFPEIYDPAIWLNIVKKSIENAGLNYNSIMYDDNKLPSTTLDEEKIVKQAFKKEIIKEYLKDNKITI